MKNEEKIKTISELYSDKSKILNKLSNLTDPNYSFVIGSQRNSGKWDSQDITIYSDLERTFIYCQKNDY